MTRLIDELPVPISAPLRGLMRLTAIVAVVGLVVAVGWLIYAGAVAIFGLLGPTALWIIAGCFVAYLFLCWLGSEDF